MIAWIFIYPCIAGKPLLLMDSFFFLSIFYLNLRENNLYQFFPPGATVKMMLNHNVCVLVWKSLKVCECHPFSVAQSCLHFTQSPLSMKDNSDLPPAFFWWPLDISLRPCGPPYNTPTFQQVLLSLSKSNNILTAFEGLLCGPSCVSYLSNAIDIDYVHQHTCWGTET